MSNTAQPAPSSGWFDEILTTRRDNLVASVYALLSEGRRWRHRRVETITPLSPYFVRRRVSVDYTVPTEHLAGLALSDKQWIVPLAWLARRQLVHFDLRDAEGRALPLLLTTQVADITRELLLLAALDPSMATRDSELVERVASVAQRASAPRAPTERHAREIIADALALRLSEQFESLVRASTSGFLLLPVVSSLEGRSVVKWQTDEHRSRARFRPDRRFDLLVDVPGMNEAASTHVEFELPDVIEGQGPELWDDRRDLQENRRVRLTAGERERSESVERPRVILQPLSTARRPYLRTTVVITPGEFLVPACVLGTLALLILILGLITHVDHLVNQQRAPAATILLAAFAALSGLVLRVEEHPFVRAALASPRMALGAIGLAAAVAAVPIALQASTSLIRTTWWFALVVCGLAWFVLLATIMTHTSWGQSVAPFIGSGRRPPDRL